MSQVDNIIITNEDFEYAEKILLSERENFDLERREFIKNLKTIDLQAVPGSGKTTVVLAKLLILEKKMPFSDGSGTLVLSHTNTAVDEIKDKLQVIAPKLFEFPNFIGTIQEFVNKFLAKPYGVNFLGVRLSNIDKDYYENKIVKKFREIYWEPKYDKPGNLFWGRHISKATRESSSTLKQKQICNNYIDEEVKGLHYDFIEKKIKLFGIDRAILADESNLKFKGIKQIIDDLLSEGIISYDYAYNLGSAYLQEYPQIKNLLQNRFKYVFVDEMQDMQDYQVNILEEIFYDEGNSVSKFQRIGDTNQSIYDGVVSEDTKWKGRDTITGNQADLLKLQGSHRLTKKIGDVVQCFGLEDNQIIGKKTITNNTGGDVSEKPFY